VKDKRYIDRTTQIEWFGIKKTAAEMVKRDVSIIVVDTCVRGDITKVRRTTVKIAEGRYLVAEYIEEDMRYRCIHELYVIDDHGRMI